MTKKRKILQHKQKPKPGGMPKSTTRPDAKKASQNTHLRDLEPTIPFSPQDAILLVGEGDLSFSRALVEHHYCENVTATVLEPNVDELTAKYPHVQDSIDVIEAEGGKILYGVDAKKMGPWAKKSGKESTGMYDRISMQFGSLSLHSIQMSRPGRTWC